MNELTAMGNVMGRRRRYGAPLLPNGNLVVTRLPDATPGILSKHALGDRQAVLVMARYNRLIDIFLGIACYSLQNHLRTTVRGLGAVETDEVYVGLDRRGSHYVIPVQARGGNKRLSRVQIERDIAVCAKKFPSLICQPVGLQLMERDHIALFSFEQDGGEIRVVTEKHYQLVRPDAVAADDPVWYWRRLSETAV